MKTIIKYSGIAIMLIIFCNSIFAQQTKPGRANEQDFALAGGRDQIEAPTAPAINSPVWKKLEKLNSSERENTVIQLEINGDLPATISSEVKKMETIWNSGNFNEALEQLRSLEESEGQLELAVGISWKVPKVVQNPTWSTDVQISPRKNTLNTCLDFDIQTGHLFAVIHYNDGGNYYWSVNISTNGGNTWTETFLWGGTSSLNDICAAVVNDYLFVAYTGQYNMSVRVRRFKVADGSNDASYSYQTLFNKGIDIKEIAVTTNADYLDKDIYLMAILENHSLEYYYATQSTDWKTWEENVIGINNADRGLDVCFNGNSTYFLFISYIDTDNKLHVDRRRSGVWEVVILDQLAGINHHTAVAAYEDYIITVYEYTYSSGRGIKYQNNDNAGTNPWVVGDIAIPSPNYYYGPDVTARQGGGFSVVYLEEAGAFDYCLYTHRDYNISNWLTPQRFNEIDPNTGSKMTMEWIPPKPGFSNAYGAVWIGGDRCTYFDRLDAEEVDPTWIEVTYPNGGEELHVGTGYTVTWNSDKYTGLVEIALSKDGGTHWIVLTDPYYAINNGGYAYEPISEHASNNCLIKVTSIENATATDQSDSPFRIIDIAKKHYVAAHVPPGFSVPTIDGNFNDAVWFYTNGSELLQRGGVPNNYLAPWNNFSDNRVSWKALWSSSTNRLYVAIEVQDDVAGTIDNSYDDLWLDDTIELYTDGDHNGGDYSNNYVDAQQWQIRRDNARHLEFLPGAYIGPAINSAISYGSSGTWFLEVEMIIYNKYSSNIKQLALNDVFGWEVWYNDSDDETWGAGFWERDHQVGWGYSGPAYYNADFFHELELGQACHIITVTSPNEGEVWYVGSPQMITWTSSGTSGRVKIEYTTNSGSNWTVIAPNVTDDGSHPWTIPNTPSTNCLVRISDIDGSPTDMSDGTFEIRVPPSQHFTTIWTGHPFQPMTIYCTKAELYGQPLVAGDEIGVFDGDKCVGAIVLSGPPSQLNPAEIICSKDDGTGNGFTEGNTIKFKVWDQSDAYEYCARAQFKDIGTGVPINPVPFTALSSAAVELTAPGLVTQTIALYTGWNMFSLAVTPDGSHNMLDVLAPILDPYVIKVIDEQGHSIVKFLGNWINSIGNWQPTEGYYINVNQNVTLHVTGTEITTPLHIPLNAGWNIISYPCLSLSQNAMSVVQSLIDNNYLIKVIDERGRSIIKMFGTWYNSIGNMNPGEGYYVNVNTNCTLIITCGSSAVVANAPDQIKVAKPVFFKHEPTGHPFEPMNIFVTEACFEGEHLNTGDEIAVYAGDKCVGASVINSPLSVSNPLEIIATKDDGNGHGFNPGDRISFKVWHSNTGEELFINDANIQYLDPQTGDVIEASLFEGLGTAVVAINLFTSAIDEELAIPHNYQLYQNHPNPFNPTTTISYDLPEETEVRLEIYDLQGNIVRRLFVGRQAAGHHTFKWDGRNKTGARAVSGVYFYQLSSGKFVETKKMILIK